jgi:RimJ/RimL family protein N-acetyltransferase
VPFHLESARLVLRNFRDSDLETFVVYRNIPEVAIYQGWKLPFPREKALELFENFKNKETVVQGEGVQLAIELKDTGELIGDVGIFVFRHDARQARIGFTITPAYWRKGFALEATMRLLKYLFDERNFHRVSADCDVLNTGSWRLLEKAGFRREAHHISSYSVGEDQWNDEYVYAMLASEWKEKR